jgi:hypothetical protein
MPVVDLTMNQWGLVLRAIRHEAMSAKKLRASDIFALSEDEINKDDINNLKTAEDRIIDMAFNLAKQLEAEQTAKKAQFYPSAVHFPS